MAPSNDITSSVKQAIKACLKEVPFELTLKSISGSDSIKSRTADIIYRLYRDNHSTTLWVIVKQNCQPSQARLAIASFDLFAMDTNYSKVFAAPFISAQTAEILRKHGWNYIDLSGNCLFHFISLGVYIKKENCKNKFVTENTAYSLYSPKSSRIMHTLLAFPNRSWNAKDLAVEAKVSLPYVYKIAKELLEKEWIVSRIDKHKAKKQWLDGTGTSLLLIEPLLLLNNWANNYKRRKVPHETYFMPGKTLRLLEEKLAAFCSEANLGYALTDLSGASRYDPQIRYSKISAYINGDIDLLSRRLNAYKVESGANLILWSVADNDRFVWFPNLFDGISVASPIQLYLDLITGKGRSAEAAETLMSNIIKPMWKNILNTQDEN